MKITAIRQINRAGEIAEFDLPPGMNIPTEEFAEGGKVWRRAKDVVEEGEKFAVFEEVATLSRRPDPR